MNTTANNVTVRRNGNVEMNGETIGQVKRTPAGAYWQPYPADGSGAFFQDTRAEAVQVLVDLATKKMTPMHSSADVMAIVEHYNTNR